MPGIGLSTPSSLTAAVQQASTKLAADPAAAQREAEAILAVAPRDPRALLILASARRRQGDAAGAAAILEPLAKAYPNAAHTQYELGTALAAQGRAAPALAALRRAVALKGDLAEAWRALGDLLFAQGDDTAAQAAFARCDRASIRDPALAPAADALLEGRVADAERLLRGHLRARPSDAAALRLMAKVLCRLERWTDAETLIDHALRLEPGHDGARFILADALFHQQKGAQALSQVERLLARDPQEAAYRNLQAACLVLLGDFDAAIPLYEALLVRFPKQPRLWLNHGHALRSVGRTREAVGAYRQAITLSPGLGDAYWSLANLKVAPLSPQDEAAMAGQLRRKDLEPDDRLHMNFALGKALEDRGDHERAFQHYATGAALRRKMVDYDASQLTDFVRRARDLFTPAFFAARSGGAPAADPIFVVGLPRSGSTLVEQILASHSAVEGTMELPDIGFIARELGDLAGEAYPASLAGLGASTRRALGERYIRDTQVQRKGAAPFFIDKMPNNFRHIGLIQLILPNAKVIDARRHPMGACFSAFKQHFAQGQAFTYDLADLGHYYRDYLELMAHMDVVLPGRVHRVIYEDLVDDLEGEVRRLLAYCGLAFEPACLRFHETERAVRTVSSEQVRRPIFREGLDLWRRYQPWLGPLEAALGPALDTWRSPPPQG